MATTEELLIEQKKLQEEIASTLKVDVTTTTATQRIKSQKATAEKRARLAEINRQLAGEPKTPPKSKGPGYVPKGPIPAENAPIGITDDIIADFAAQGIDVENPASFLAGAPGSTALVYFGETSKNTDLKFKGGRPVSSVVPTTGFKNKVVTDFWTDEALQNKIIGAYAAKGKSIGQLEAYGIWEKLVTVAAEIYQGGRGAKVTPMQLLSDTLKSVQGDEAAIPTRAISKLDKATSFEAFDSWAEKKLMRTLKADEKEELFKELEKLNTGTLTEYKKVKNKKTGKMENVQTTTPGLTPSAVQSSIEQKLIELNPDDADRTSRIKFADWLSGNVAGA
jgi:hypothetical protein